MVNAVHWQPTCGLMVQANRLGPEVGSHLAVLHSSHELGELLQCFNHDDSTTKIVLVLLVLLQHVNPVSQIMFNADFSIGIEYKLQNIHNVMVLLSVHQLAYSMSQRHIRGFQCNQSDLFCVAARRVKHCHTHLCLSRDVIVVIAFKISR